MTTFLTRNVTAVRRTIRDARRMAGVPSHIRADIRAEFDREAYFADETDLDDWSPPEACVGAEVLDLYLYRVTDFRGGDNELIGNLVIDCVTGRVQDQAHIPFRWLDDTLPTS